MKYDISYSFFFFFADVFYQVEEVLSIPSLLRIFRKKFEWLLDFVKCSFFPSSNIIR